MISVGFSTYDRMRNIPELLAALSAQEDPGEEWEILAVDNGGFEGMQELIELNLPKNGRYIKETTPGSSHARNRFFAEAQGELLILTDDDALPAPGWIKAFGDASRRYPEIDIFTGPVHYEWRCDKPSWFPPPLGHEIVLVYKCEFGNSDQELTANACVGGHNLCLRRSRLKELGGVDPRLGPGSRHGSSGEDLELLRRWMELRVRAMYVAEARTGHRIYEERLMIKTLVENYHRAGYSEGWVSRIYSTRKKFLPMPAWWFRFAFVSPQKHLYQLFYHYLKGESSQVFYHRLKLSQWRGQMRFLKDLLLGRISPSRYTRPIIF